VAAGARFVAILDRTPETLFGSLLPDCRAAAERRWFKQVECRSKLGPADFTRVPWKNGGGTSLDMLVVKDGAGDQLWRVSLADIEQDRPFSDFPGIDRVFAVVDGAGVDLKFIDGWLPVPRDTVLHFPGEAAPDCRLHAGPAKALNVLLTRGRARGDMLIVTSAVAVPPPPAGGTLMLVPFDGTWEHGGVPVTITEASYGDAPITAGRGRAAVITVELA
jgi:environmental stress-induced protein Ves